MKDIEIICAFEGLLDKKLKDSNDLFYKSIQELQSNIITSDEFKLIAEENKDMSRDTYIIKMKITDIFKKELENMHFNGE